MITTSQYAELDKLEESLNVEIAHLQRQRTINLIIGVVLVIVIGGYFCLMSWKAKDMMQPEDIAAMASQRVVSYLPDARANLEESARKEVPLLVDGMIDKMLNESLPSVHVSLKALIIDSADKAMDVAEDDFFAQVGEHLKTHGAALRSLSEDLATDEGAQAFEDAVYDSLAEVANEPEVQADLLGYGAALEHLVGTLEYLAQDEIALTLEEESMRDLISIFRELMNRARTTS